MIGFQLILDSVLLGAGLAMDAFSVSIANGISEPKMRKSRVCIIAGVYAFFQFVMPLIGWFCVHSIAEIFTAFQPFIPWIAFILLSFIGGKMIWEGVRGKTGEGEQEEQPKKLTIAVLTVQGIATSIDALSVGFTIADYAALQATVSALIIGAVTFVICVLGIIFGKKWGEKLSDKATVVGGIVLIVIGLKILIENFIV